MDARHSRYIYPPKFAAYTNYVRFELNIRVLGFPTKTIVNKENESLVGVLRIPRHPVRRVVTRYCD